MWLPDFLFKDFKIIATVIISVIILELSVNNKLNNEYEVKNQ